MKEVLVTYGKKIVDGDKVSYLLGNTFNGECYKDRVAFKSGKGICYISEYGYQSMDEDLVSLDVEYDQSDMTEEEYKENRKSIIRTYGYTRQDFLDLVGWSEDLTDREKEIATKLAEIVFEGVDWQTPCTYFNEIEIKDFAEDLGLTEEEVEKYFAS